MAHSSELSPAAARARLSFLSRLGQRAVIHAPAIGLEGWVTCYALAPDGTQRDRRHFRNHITDAGLDYMGSGNIATVIAYFGVGTGTTAPVDGNTALETPATIGGVARHNTAHTGNATTGVSAGAYAYYKRVLISAAATGDQTYYEFGFFDAAAAGTMFNRQLFESGGVPTGFTLLTGEQLVIELEVRAYMPTIDVTGTVDISGTSYDYTVRAGNNAHASWEPNSLYSQFNSTAGAEVFTSQALVAASADLGAGTAPSAVSLAAYVNGNFYRDVTYTWGTATFTADIGMIGWWKQGAINRFQLRLAATAGGTPVPKTNLNVFSITIRHQWARRP